MPRQECHTVYLFNELSDYAKEKAREWYREGALDYEWWDSVYEDVANRADELGINLRQKRVKLMNGETRQQPEIYFSGFGHQGSGSSYVGHWDASKMKLATLRAEIGQETRGDKELRRIADILKTIGAAYPDASAEITNGKGYGGDVSVRVSACAGNESELEYGTPEYLAEEKAMEIAEKELEEILTDFNYYIFEQLESSFEWLNADEQIDESIVSNEYEFNEDGSIGRY